jgi:hypothetical protein
MISVDEGPAQATSNVFVVGPMSPRSVPQSVDRCSAQKPFQDASEDSLADVTGTSWTVVPDRSGYASFGHWITICPKQPDAIKQLRSKYYGGNAFTRSYSSPSKSMQCQPPVQPPTRSTSSKHVAVPRVRIGGGRRHPVTGVDRREPIIPS